MIHCFVAAFPKLMRTSFYHLEKVTTESQLSLVCVYTMVLDFFWYRYPYSYYHLWMTLKISS